MLSKFLWDDDKTDMIQAKRTRLNGVEEKGKAICHVIDETMRHDSETEECPKSVSSCEILGTKGSVTLLAYDDKVNQNTGRGLLGMDFKNGINQRIWNAPYCIAGSRTRWPPYERERHIFARLILGNIRWHKNDVMADLICAKNPSSNCGHSENM
ncbi:hypothetical protein G6F70_001838 [Rhizopus microsporus]|nr:hypothetical protein G6F71_002038 [Rhizopus microsporus]KAG1202915.1 hypothetical protein G6F70_001838 [Rhizopus microsporus]KAG1214941.1 hypothetical protein G6F69_001467 [Rhizopus microsporus]KAG1237143.1 hypothetical protein G6F67_001438 [Rhizopus microsporus]KAG1266523.1 hypothetical protein G6F68_002690 [Rhizopus microsporus]